MPSSLRNYIAVTICLSGAVLGAIAIHRGWANASTVAFDVAWLWCLAGNWLGGSFTRDGWKRLNKPMGAIYQDARQRKLPKSPPLARAMNGGGLILVLAGIAGWFV